VELTSEPVCSEPSAPSSPRELVKDSAVGKSSANLWMLRDDFAALMTALQGLLAKERVHTSATIAVLIPAGFPRPTEKSVGRFGLRHPADARGWFPVSDGSALGLLQLRPKEAAATSRDDESSVFSGFSGHSGMGEGQAQALCLVRLRLVGLLAEHLNDGRHLLELWRASLRDCHAVLSQMIPGMRAWPLHDDHVRREVLLKIAKERFQNPRNLLRLDRGRRYLDVVRMHFGEEVAFLFTWQAHYLTCLAWLALVTVPFMVVQGGPLWEMWGASYDMLTHTVLTVVFGVAITELWPVQADRKVHRWHTKSECLSRWHTLVLRILESRAMRRPGFQRRLIPPSPSQFPARRRTSTGSSSISGLRGRTSTVEEQAREACSAVLHSVQTGASDNETAAVGRSNVGRLLRASLVVPILLAEWAMILVFFNFTVWFEIWVIFDWGGCREFNQKAGEWKCLAADERRGMLGVAVGALPSICEGAFFELLLAISRATANSFISLYDFPTSEGRDFAFVEVVGKVGFILTLALAFVPVWDERDANGCASFWDHSLLGKFSLACLKGQVPYKVRLNMLRSAMKGPMLVSGLVGIGIKTLLPMLLESWRRCFAREAPGWQVCGLCCRHRLGRYLLAPADFVLRVLLFIFQADHDVMGGLKSFCEWPPTLVVQNKRQTPIFSCAGGLSKEEHSDMAREARLWRALLEGQRREFDPFNEYVEVLLHFLWICCFAIVWPLGCAFALLNQFLEYRFDGLKLLSVRRRRFPSTRHMSVAWVPRFMQAICHIGIFVNVAILMLPYRIASHLSGSSEVLDSIEDIEPILSSSEAPRIVLLFMFLWAFLVTLRAVCIWLVRRALRYFDRGRHTRTVLHKDREAEAVMSEQGPLADALDGLCAQPQGAGLVA